MKCQNLEKQSSYGYRSVLALLLVLPFYLLSFPLYLIMSIFHRILSLLVSNRRKDVRAPAVFIKAPDIPKKKVPDDEWNDLFINDSEAWTVLLEKPQTLGLMRMHLDHCLDYDVSPNDRQYE